MNQQTRLEFDDPYQKTAIFSEDRTYRYVLRRVVNERIRKRLLMIMLNPSTADEYRDDPTIRRCKSFALYWGFGTLTICNLFAYRATDPRALRHVALVDPIGPENNAYIIQEAQQSDRIVCAWGTHGAFQDRGVEVARMLGENGHRLYHVGLTKDGHPRHPLYLPGESFMMRWEKIA
jgi:hypothetical protein